MTYRSRFFLALSMTVVFSAPVKADGLISRDPDSGRLTIIEENDKFASNDDRHYTQGMRISYLSKAVTQGGWWDTPYAWLGNKLPIFLGEDRKRKYDWTVLGQSLFTPTNTARINPSLKDRPYVAWLYTGAGLLQETNKGRYHTLENVELLAGVVGPAALGRMAQNDFHQFVGVDSALGWNNQIKTEPGFVLSYEKKWRFQQPLTNQLAVDVIPEMGASLGNVLTYGETSMMVRFGQNLAADYGPNRIRPSLSGTGWFDADKMKSDLGWYVFLGTQGRAIGHSVFLDGTTFASGPSVDKKYFVADFTGGAALFWASTVRLDFTVTQRTKEFYGQQGHPDRFGGINLTFQL